MQLYHSLQPNSYRLVARSTRYADIISMRINTKELYYPHFWNFMLLKSHPGVQMLP